MFTLIYILFGTLSIYLYVYYKSICITSIRLNKLFNLQITCTKHISFSYKNLDRNKGIYLLMWLKGPRIVFQTNWTQRLKETYFFSVSWLCFSVDFLHLPDSGFVVVASRSRLTSSRCKIRGKTTVFSAFPANAWLSYDQTA